MGRRVPRGADARNGTSFGHGGAFATDMMVETKQGLVLVYLVQSGGFIGDGGKAKGAFQRAAIKEFGKVK